MSENQQEERNQFPLQSSPPPPPPASAAPPPEKQRYQYATHLRVLLERRTRTLDKKVPSALIKRLAEKADRAHIDVTTLTTADVKDLLKECAKEDLK